MQLAIEPDIVHVVGFTEGTAAATAAEVIESVKIVKGVIRNTFGADLGLSSSEHVIRRKAELVSEARYLLRFIEDRYYQYQNPLTNPKVLADCVKCGILDAVHLKKDAKYRGTLRTRLVDGKCVAVGANGRVLRERERLAGLDLPLVELD